MAFVVFENILRNSPGATEPRAAFAAGDDDDPTEVFSEILREASLRMIQEFQARAFFFFDLMRSNTSQ
jgi:hypothetical protein